MHYECAPPSKIDFKTYHKMQGSSVLPPGMIMCHDEDLPEMWPLAIHDLYYENVDFSNPDNHINDYMRREVRALQKTTVSGYVLLRADVRTVNGRTEQEEIPLAPDGSFQIELSENVRRLGFLTLPHNSALVRLKNPYFIDLT